MARGSSSLPGRTGKAPQVAWAVPFLTGIPSQSRGNMGSGPRRVSRARPRPAESGTARRSGRRAARAGCRARPSCHSMTTRSSSPTSDERDELDVLVGRRRPARAGARSRRRAPVKRRSVARMCAAASGPAAAASAKTTRGLRGSSASAPTKAPIARAQLLLGLGAGARRPPSATAPNSSSVSAVEDGEEQRARCR